jgi:membrane-associated phospholipid phosphatase
MPADRTADALSLCTWALIGALGILSALLLAGTRFSLLPGAFNSALGCTAAFAGFALLLRLRGWVRVAIATSGAAQLFALMILVPLVSVILAGTNLPLADGSLEGLDRLFGADALAVARVQMEHPVWMAAMNHTYASLLWQPLALVLIGSIFNPNHLARFVFAWTLSLCICLAVFPFVPALGFYLHHAVDPAAAQSVQVPAAWRHAEILLPARSGALRELGWEQINGIITFPSFHAAAAVLLGWGILFAPRIVRWPMLALNALMLVSTVVIGGHYLVDVLAGCAVAGLAILAAKRLAHWCLMPTGSIAVPTVIVALGATGRANSTARP